jgi:UDP-N-acetyl-D-mannosaminuronic acid dehydrogenase
MNYSNCKVCIIGLGYIGLPTAALLSSKGYEVVGVDVNAQVVDTINQGKIHIVEPDLAEYVDVGVKAGKLSAKTVPEFADVFIIAVPTPFTDNHKPDLSFVDAATNSIAPYIRKGNIIILESTSPVGTTQRVFSQLKTLGVAIDDIYLAYCPERVLPGKIMKELIENDRIVGGINSESTAIVKKFYENFVSGNVLDTNSQTAEMCKLVENSYRDVNIAFANELSLICGEANIDVWELIKLANHHPRVNILQPGVGVGGHCIAVDPWFLVSDFPDISNLIKTARIVNESKTDWVINQISNDIIAFEEANDRKPIVGLLGLTFKPNIDDLRESPSLLVAKRLSKCFENVFCTEPNVSHVENITLLPLQKLLDSSDLIYQLVSHNEFLEISNENRLKIRKF